MSDERLAEQKHVVEKAASSKMLDKYDGVMISGDNSKIIKSLAGELRNTHNTVFKHCLNKKSCEHCGEETQLDRAHTISKMEIAKQVLDELHPLPNIPINVKDFIKEFVMRHTTIGVWMLCKSCHKELG